MKEFFKKQSQWPAIEEISRVLLKHGKRAVLAGGCVRDALLGREPNDLDVATDATPDMIETYFERVIPVGKSFGVCRVVIHGESIEVATFREESDYQDGRRPEKVVYSTLEKDARRRDFTVNAMFWDLEKNVLVDLTNGREDLKQKLIRTVGEPEERFGEDHLRVLRAVRFAAQLGFEIEDKTFQAMRKLAPTVAKISRERITEEMRKGLLSANPVGFLQLLHELGLLAEWVDGNVPDAKFFQMFFATQATGPVDETVAWSLLIVLYMLVGETGKPLDQALAFYKSMKLSNETLEGMATVAHTGDFIYDKNKGLVHFVKLAKTGYLDSAEDFWTRWERAAGASDNKAGKISEYRDKYFDQGVLPAPLIGGADLLALGVKAGPELGALMERAYLEQLELKIKNKAQWLEIVKNWKA